MSKEDSEVINPKSDEMAANSEEKSTKQIVAIERESHDESTSRISWLHSKEKFTSYAEITLNYSYLHDLMSPDLGNLCESFKNL